ncbi:cysteine/serine endopeptidase inhibitor [Kibdelosporangium aridum]|uniref:Rare lipoprotein A (RlpA)-like double-psi beta-barrel n=1 Tax=Kibdelosporangium aridum TaxID=2030 RepID=A0A1W2FZN6_KIBAR|nr:cysteine/serine endopeptidase inhibitor [Kibdelosporangium aridum]SMD27096.1 Rare lipoprotein A (RlpA)-like double-psi beta-barrel [Kibdelosporangium aridum]
MTKIGKALGVLAAAVALPLAVNGTAYADIPFDRPINGNATYYDNSGYGACGTWVNAATEMLVAVPASYWTSPNPNNDPLCKGVSVQVTYNGRTITVPVKDKCPSCGSGHIDLSRPAFAQLADPNLGNIPLTWKFVRS